jgi:hypothetical protein
MMAAAPEALYDRCLAWVADQQFSFDLDTFAVPVEVWTAQQTLVLLTNRVLSGYNICPSARVSSTRIRFAAKPLVTHRHYIEGGRSRQERTCSGETLPAFSACTKGGCGV